MKRYFITGTGTDIGKTFITCALAWQMRQRGVAVKALKPVASGFDPAHPAQSDGAQLLAAQELALSEIDSICPWRFRAPLSPDMAAGEEGKTIVFDEIITFCNRPDNQDVLLIEGVGGVMSPVTAEHTVLDWMEALAIPVILVTGSYVGSISHTLTALHALQSRKLTIQCIIVNTSENSAATAGQTCASLARHRGANTPIHTVPRLAATQELWKNVPKLDKVWS